MGEESACNAGDGGESGSVLGLGRSPGRGNGNPVHCSCLENPMDKGAWQSIDHGVAESDTAEATEHVHSRKAMHIPCPFVLKESAVLEGADSREAAQDWDYGMVVPVRKVQVLILAPLLPETS